MNIEKLNELVASGESLAPFRNELIELVSKYPYSGPFRMLLAKSSKDAGHIDQRRDLLAAAAHCSSRKALFDLMFAETIIQQAEAISGEIEAMEEVSEEDVIELVWHAPEVESDIESQIEAVEREEVIEAVAESIKDWIAEPTAESATEPAAEPATDPAIQHAIEGGEPEIQAGGSANSTFGKWLAERAKSTGFGETSQNQEKVERGASAIIDAFLQKENPRIGTPREVGESVEKWASQGLLEDESIVTETMAKLYAQQGQMKRARKAFKLLALKYPDKSVYFAAQLKKLSKK